MWKALSRKGTACNDAKKLAKQRAGDNDNNTYETKRKSLQRAGDSNANELAAHNGQPHCENKI
jgi:hypothetical protein